MTRPAPAATRTLSALAAAALMAGCVTLPGKPALDEVRARSNPVDASRRTVTNFSEALRCMDAKLFEQGTRDITLMMEEMRDATQKVPVSARDMMTSAISEMTRRSRAVRLSVFGSDQSNLAQLLQQAQRTQPFAVLPEFNLRGTISQFDEDVQRQSSTLGLVAERFGLRLGNETRYSVLGFDAALVRTDSFTLVPGVSSKNTTVIARRDSGAADGSARILNAGGVFSFSTARNEGPSQAARNMIELAAVELVGKLVRAPYWQCLGLSDEHPEVRREIDDWFHGMDEAERITFVKDRLRERRWYDGALDASTGGDYATALAAYRRAIGLRADGPLDLTFFRRFITQAAPIGPLAARPRAAAHPAAAGSASAPASASASAPASAGASAGASAHTPTSTTLAVAPLPDAPAAPPARVFVQTLQPGRAALQIVPAAVGYLYCFAQDPASGAIRRIFPNRFVRDAHVEPGRSVALPGAARFVLDPAHRHACVHSEREIYNDLPPTLRWGDFDEVRLKGFDEVRQAFAQAAGRPLALLEAQPVGR